MQFVASNINGNYLSEIHRQCMRNAYAVKAAVAYAAGEYHIIDDCHNQSVPLVYYGRYDATVPVALPVLRRFLDARSPSFTCRLVPDIFHPKVIWWQGAGAYIGSANLTNSGWFNNVEAGLYLDNTEIIEHGMDEQLNKFFDWLDQKSYKLTQEIYEELRRFQEQTREINEQRKNIENSLTEQRSLPLLSALTHETRNNIIGRWKQQFIREWTDTLQIMRDIGARLITDEHRPPWISQDVAIGIQVDQFLHAFYYTHVKQGNRSQHVKIHNENIYNPEGALNTSIRWWKSVETPPHNENITINEWAPFLREKLAKDKIQSLDEGEFIQVCERIHALLDHSRQVRNETLGIPPSSGTVGIPERIRKLGKWLYEQESPAGMKILHTIEYVLYGGELAKIADRMWEVTHSDEWRIPHFGISTIGEIVGWALPDEFPPRNGRTSKALYALGYDVTIHTE